jgi:hypothetical protein
MRPNAGSRREFQATLESAQEIVAICTEQVFACLLTQGMILKTGL